MKPENPWGWAPRRRRAYQRSRFWVMVNTVIFVGCAAWNAAAIFEAETELQRLLAAAVVVLLIVLTVAMWRSHLAFGQVVAYSVERYEAWEREHR